jgi:hypothetical protein
MSSPFMPQFFAGCRAWQILSAILDIFRPRRRYLPFHRPVNIELKWWNSLSDTLAMRDLHDILPFPFNVPLVERLCKSNSI